MTHPLRPALLALALGLPLIGCGEDGGGKADAGAADAGDVRALLGLTERTCFEYSLGDTATALPALGLSVVTQPGPTTVQYLDGGGSAQVQAIQLTYRKTGVPVLTDSVKVEGRTLVLLKRAVGQGGETLEYRPSPVMLKLPLKNAEHVENGDEVRGFGGAYDGGWMPHALTFDVISTTVTVPAGTFAGFQVPYVEPNAPQRLASWTFAPEKGPVLIQGQIGATTQQTYKLQTTRQLPEGSDDCGSGVAAP